MTPPHHREELLSECSAPPSLEGGPLGSGSCLGGSHQQPVRCTTIGLRARLLSRLKSGTMLLADRGYDADWIRALVGKRSAWANIPPRSNRNEPICFSPYLYRSRNLVERFFNKIKHCRRVATRYDKLAANYLAFIQLASIRLWLRVNESAPKFV